MRDGSWRWLLRAGLSFPCLEIGRLRERHRWAAEPRSYQRLEESSFAGIFRDRTLDSANHAANRRAAHSQVTRDLTGACCRAFPQEEQEQEPISQGDMGAVEHGANRGCKRPTAALTLPAHSCPIAARVSTDFVGSAVRTTWATLPADSFEVLNCLRLGLEGSKDVRDFHSRVRGNSSAETRLAQVQKRPADVMPTGGTGKRFSLRSRSRAA